MAKNQPLAEMVEHYFSTFLLKHTPLARRGVGEDAAQHERRVRDQLRLHVDLDHRVMYRCEPILIYGYGFDFTKENPHEPQFTNRQVYERTVQLAANSPGGPVERLVTHEVHGEYGLMITAHLRARS